MTTQSQGEPRPAVAPQKTSDQSVPPPSASAAPAAALLGVGVVSVTTPWPWLVEAVSPVGGSWPARICDLGYGIWVREADGIVDDIPDEATSLANARLIAAAPELLDALRELRHACAEAYKDCRVDAEAFVRAGNVIAKAEGR